MMSQRSREKKELDQISQEDSKIVARSMQGPPTSTNKYLTAMRKSPLRQRPDYTGPATARDKPLSTTS